MRAINHQPLRWHAFVLLCAVVLAIGLSVEAAGLKASFVVREAPDEGKTGILFDATASTAGDGELVSYQWVFGDGTTGSGKTVIHLYPQVDAYRVTLLVRASSGESQMIDKVIDLSRLETQAQDRPQPVEDPPASHTPVGHRVGERAPALRLNSLQGEPVELADFLGQTVLLEFWSSACPACRASTAKIETLRQAYADQGLVVVLIVLNSAVSDAQRFLSENGYSEFVALYDSPTHLRDTKDTYGVGSIPIAFVVDKMGIIRFSGHPGRLGEDLLSQWL